MSEKLLTLDDVANRLRVVRRSVYRHLATLKAKGLQQVPMGTRSIRFRETSLNRIIERAAERGERIF